MGLHCELIKEPRFIWSFVPWSDGISIHPLLMVNQNMKQFFLGISPYTRGYRLTNLTHMGLDVQGVHYLALPRSRHLFWHCSVNRQDI